jgi:hypothetical protein
VSEIAEAEPHKIRVVESRRPVLVREAPTRSRDRMISHLPRPQFTQPRREAMLRRFPDTGKRRSDRRLPRKLEATAAFLNTSCTARSCENPLE